MRAIDYQRHCLLLCIAAVVFALLLSLPPLGWLSFGLIGVLHALVVVGSLKIGAPLIRRCVFVSSAALISVSGPLIGFGLAGLAADRMGDLTLWVGLTLASVVGASTYWLLVRWCLISSLNYRSLAFTVGLCGVVTPMAYLGASALTGFGQRTAGVPAHLADVVPTFAWWCAFSYSLYRGEVFYRNGRGTVQDARIQARTR